MQKFNKGDHVRVVKDLGIRMSHFQSDCEAIVEYSYTDKFGGDCNDYGIFIKDRGSVAWYYEHQLELIEANRLDLLKHWKDAQQKKIDQVSELDWIFENGSDVLNKPHGASVQALANCFGLTNLWGSKGEGMDLHSNTIQTLQLAQSYLVAGDKQGWLDKCRTITVREIKTEAFNDPLIISAAKDSDG